MSNDPTYTDQDKAKFAELEKDKFRTPPPRRSETRGDAGGAAAPAYTQKDLEKFQKMFGSGFEPDEVRRPGEDMRLSSKRDSTTKSTPAYSNSDEDKFDRIRPANEPRKSSAIPGKGGRIGVKKSTDTYSGNDLKQFEALEALTRKSSANQTQSSAAKSENSPDRKWRFPELHDQSPGLLNMPSRRRANLHSQKQTPSRSRVKLRYFD